MPHEFAATDRMEEVQTAPELAFAWANATQATQLNLG
jgi:hypothetical protein